jgi:putative FmdB family regulatory protein
MPIYEYECTKCSERFSVRQSIGGDGSELNGPKCQVGNPKRLVSAFFDGGSGRRDIRPKLRRLCLSGLKAHVSLASLPKC